MTSMASANLPITLTDPINAAILAVSEDRIQGFNPDPIRQIALQSGIDLPTVHQRIAAMLRGGTIRRVRQTLMATNLARGALVAWVVPEEKLSAAFEWMNEKDPFSGHIVIRSTDQAITGSHYRLWTTLKVPQGYSLEKHCQLLCKLTGATKFKLLPANKLFALGVGHIRRKGMEPGSHSPELAEVVGTQIVELSDMDWRVLTALKREFSPEEIEAAATRPDATFWDGRAAEAGVDPEAFCTVARSLNERGVIGRFSTFLEHVKPLATGERVTKFNALFHWAVPRGSELEAGRQVGRFHIMTHAYWREAGEEFGNVNIMGVAHGTDKQLLLAHKAAIDKHLESVGIPVHYTNIFWGGRSEIKPSEISPFAYEDFCREHGIDPQSMRQP
ncbi:MAG: Lrp/AsnC family transcriptional regulator [Phycisphaerales bacterium]|nr:Lrp/AsnC family transcriptional regulator [Phycisphaerales bacterium]